MKKELKELKVRLATILAKWQKVKAQSVHLHDGPLGNALFERTIRLEVLREEYGLVADRIWILEVRLAEARKISKLGAEKAAQRKADRIAAAEAALAPKRPKGWGQTWCKGKPNHHRSIPRESIRYLEAI